MLVEILTAAFIASYAMFGVNVATCAECENIYDSDCMAWIEYPDGETGYTCLECVEHWNE